MTPRRETGLRDGSLATIDKHFSTVASRYRELRTLDTDPVRHIRDHFPRRPSVGVDVGCGTGRYTEELYKELPRGTVILAVDVNHDMLQVLHQHRVSKAGIQPVRAPAEGLPLRPHSADWVTTFNAVHHMDLPGFLRSAAEVLKPSGKLFIYTRTPEQNAQSVWGRLFPGFADKETRLHSEAALRQAVESTEGLTVDSTRTFRYERSATPEQLREQAENAHYSTFSLFGREEFAEALQIFLRRLPDPLVRWCDENLLLICERRPITHT